MTRVRPPGGCLYHRRPEPKTVMFGGVFINLALISRVTGIDHSLVSRYFRGTRVPTIKSAQAVARALMLGLEEFLTLLAAHTAQQKAQRRAPRRLQKPQE